MDARTEREKRLADALRQNLLRRKAQAREPAPPPPSPTPAPEPEPEPEPDETL